ncbi:PIN domain-containing protein [Glycomyces dulcitolivorans]|jgi:predicted nucleic acid-binding protein|uniref:PIN domain-containing protein n=1 Tax=Glycomyces dulcitolivorans TaxID=2200759 RepID=UPI000DD3508C|nr:PIN domain-containing protein [Glycomyces dulcitolivorans]
MSPIILDTSAVLALFDSSYEEHDGLTEAVEKRQGPLVVSPFIVAEVDYMLKEQYDAGAARQFNEDVALGGMELASWGPADHAEALQVMQAFQGDDYIGIADASNVVLADRYRTNSIMTLDQRHFRILQPIWGPDYFTLLPYDSEQ